MFLKLNILYFLFNSAALRYTSFMKIKIIMKNYKLKTETVLKFLL